MWDNYTFFISGFSWDQKEYLPSADAKLGFHCTSSDVKAINKLSNNFWRLISSKYLSLMNREAWKQLQVVKLHP